MRPFPVVLVQRVGELPCEFCGHEVITSAGARICPGCGYVAGPPCFCEEGH